MNNKLLNKVITYYSGGPYKITPTGCVAVKDTDIAKILILARHHYLEKTVNYPITVKKDLLAAISFDISELTEDFFVFHKIISTIDGVSEVVIWQVPKIIIPSNVLMVMPETFLFSALLEKNQIITFTSLTSNKSVFVAKSLKSIFSICDMKDRLSIFTQSVGIEANRIIEVSPEEFSEKLLLALRKSTPQLLLGFWVTRKLESTQYINKCKPFLLPTSVLLTLYLVFSSIYIQSRFENQTELVKQQKSEIDTVLNLQREISDLQRQSEGLKAQKGKTKPLWKIWQVLSPLYEKGVMFKFIRFNGEFVFFKANYESASAILEYLYNLDEISSPMFTTAIRKEAGLESFIIKFSLDSAEK